MRKFIWVNLLLILLFILSISCNDLKKQNIISNSTNVEDIDTSKPTIVTLYMGKVFPTLFEAAFINGTQITQSYTTYRFFKYDLGRIKVESGKMIACDPIVMHDASPFVDSFPIGKYVVSLAVAKTGNDNRVAFSRIVFSDSPVAKWEFALKKGQKQIPLTDSNIYCYGVDGGMGLFIDSVSNEVFNQKGQKVWENVFIKGMENNDLGSINEFDKYNLATFSTGYGDGCYATYIGRDHTGRICKLLTDFQLVEWWKMDK